MLASRIGIVGALVAICVLTVELGVAIAWRARMSTIDLRVATATHHVPNRAGY